MKRLFSSIFCFLLLIGIFLVDADADTCLMHEGSGQAAAGGYCASQSWNTFTSFRLDGDNTDNDHYACLTSGTETLTDNATDPVGNPAVETPADTSKGQAIVSNADNEYLVGDNTNAYFISTYGEIMFLVNLGGDNTANQVIIEFEGANFNDELVFTISATLGKLSVTFEGQNLGIVSIGEILQLDTYVGDWCQIHIKWDTTRCDDDGHTEPCDTDASEQELAVRYRCDGDQNQVWDAAFSAWAYETSAVNMKPWNTEPTTDDMLYGMQGTHVVDISLDDIEISNAQPSW